MGHILFTQPTSAITWDKQIEGRVVRTEGNEMRITVTTVEQIESIWHLLQWHDSVHPPNDTDTFVKCVHTGSVENKQLSFTFMERLEQAKEEAVAAQDFEAACDIRDLMDKFKKDGK